MHMICAGFYISFRCDHSRLKSGTTAISSDGTFYFVCFTHAVLQAAQCHDALRAAYMQLGDHPHALQAILRTSQRRFAFDYIRVVASSYLGSAPLEPAQAHLRGAAPKLPADFKGMVFDMAGELVDLDATEMASLVVELFFDTEGRGRVLEALQLYPKRQHAYLQVSQILHRAVLLN